MSDERNVPEQKNSARPPYDADRIREMRERLYARSGGDEIAERHSIPQQNTVGPIARTSVPVSAAPSTAPTPPPLPPEPPQDSLSMKTRRTSLQKKLVIGSILFFVGALIVSSLMLFFGGSSVSGENITIRTTGPLQVGGGDNLPFQVTVANQNQVPMQSATLIIEYPQGTQSTTEQGKGLTIERRSLDSIAPGESVNVDLSARVFGEENAEQEIRVRVEYRVTGSSATFEKQADPFTFKIGTSPLVLTFDAVEAISSGQEVTVGLTVQSNAPAPMDNVLVKIAYPSGFDFSQADPKVISGEDTWSIDHINPGEKKHISVKGLLTGLETEKPQFTATAGVANNSGSFDFSSQLAAAHTEITLEKAFLNLGVSINGNSDPTVVIGKEEQATVDIQFTNSLNTTIYDGKVSVTLSGNGLDAFEISPHGGFYDSTTHTITWVGAEEDSLKEMVPGDTKTLTFGIYPQGGADTGVELKLSVAAKAHRVMESRPTEEIDGAVERSIRIEGIPKLTSGVYYKTGPFTNSGPTPPVAGVTTQYTLTLHATAGSNDITGTEVTTSLPQYVNWLDLVTDGDTVTYNATTRVVTWKIGNIDVGQSADVSMQVSFKPSASQVGSTPTLLDTQRLKATDRFTGTLVRADAPALTTRISSVEGESEKDGRVQAQ